MPSEIPMPSPNAISPSGLKSNSQFYSSYEGNNPRRRPAQDPIGKILKDHFKCSVEHICHRFYFRKIFLCSGLYLGLRISSLLLLSFFYKCLKNLTSA